MIYILICCNLISDTINHHNSIPIVDLSIFLFFGALLVSVKNPIVNVFLISVGLICYGGVTSLLSLPIDVRHVFHGDPEFLILFYGVVIIVAACVDFFTRMVKWGSADRLSAK